MLLLKGDPEEYSAISSSHPLSCSQPLSRHSLWVNVSQKGDTMESTDVWVVTCAGKRNN
jgi:hypothetical protein